VIDPIRIEKIVEEKENVPTTKGQIYDRIDDSLYFEDKLLSVWGYLHENKIIGDTEYKYYLNDYDYEHKSAHQMIRYKLTKMKKSMLLDIYNVLFGVLLNGERIDWNNTDSKIIGKSGKPKALYKISLLVLRMAVGDQVVEDSNGEYEDYHDVPEDELAVEYNSKYGADIDTDKDEIDMNDSFDDILEYKYESY